MAAYKKIIFLKAIKVRYQAGEGTVNEIIETYAKLTEVEKDELRNEFS